MFTQVLLCKDIIMEVITTNTSVSCVAIVSRNKVVFGIPKEDKLLITKELTRRFEDAKMGFSVMSESEVRKLPVLIVDNREWKVDVK